MAAIIALDIGEKRTGVARSPIDVAFASPLKTLDTTTDFNATLLELLKEEKARAVVVGLPRGMDGQETAQTAWIKEVAQRLKGQIDIPLYYQDEAATSLQAKAELEAKGKDYSKDAVDALAATYILQDFLDEKFQSIKKDLDET
jgi:putative Holliday junction resolvase